MKILLLGDFCATQKNMRLFRDKSLQPLFNDTLPVLADSDATFVNVECAITESENAITKWGPNLKVCRESADVLKSIGVTLCGLSNNHIFDFGKEGAVDTMKALDEVGIPYTGFGQSCGDSRTDYVLQKNGERIAFIAVCEHEFSYALENRMGSRPFDPFETMADIRKAKKEADRVIVLYHGGKELCQYPSPRLVNACREMVHNGADVILCQHTHCIGCYENYQGAHILYGQGNFHFLMPGMPDIWQQFLLVKYDTLLNEMEFIPAVNTDCGIELAKGAQKEEILSQFAARNQSMLDGTWKNGWREFCDSVKQQYLSAANQPVEIDADTVFSHYLDCEAHTDVWRELFKTANHRNELD